MAFLTPMTPAQARAIGAIYGLEVAAVQPLAKGVNSNFRFELGGGEAAFARVHETVSPDVVAARCRLTDHLARAGVPTPRPLRRREDGEAVTLHAGKPLALFPFVRGQWCCQATVGPDRVRRVGGLLAQLHRAGASFRDPPDGMAEVVQLPRQVAALSRGAQAAELADDLRRLAAQLADLGPGITRRASVPVIHGDLFRDNVLWVGDELTAVLDFELAGAGDPLFDLLVTVLAWCFGAELDQQLARALVAGYRAVLPLSNTDLQACYDQARLAAVRWAVGRIAGYELQPRGAIAYKDYRRFLARLDAIEQIGPRCFPAWLSGDA